VVLKALARSGSVREMRSASAENLWSMRETRASYFSRSPRCFRLRRSRPMLLDEIGQEGRQLAIHVCVAPAVETAWVGRETMRWNCPLALAIERQVKWPRAEKADEEGQYPIRAPAGAIGRGTAGMFANRQRELDRFPEKRVVRLQRVPARSRLARDGIVVTQYPSFYPSSDPMISR
jgi:hypothetical protein